MVETRQESELNEIKARQQQHDDRMGRLESMVLAISEAVNKLTATTGSNSRRTTRNRAEGPSSSRNTRNRAEGPSSSDDDQGDFRRRHHQESEEFDDDDEQERRTPRNRRRSNRSEGGDDTHDRRFSGNRQRDERLPTRLTRMDFPRFNGDDVEDWVYSVEMFFQIDKTVEETKLDYACAHLTGRARRWFSSHLQHRNPGRRMLWNELKRLVLKEFGPSELDDPLDEWKNLKQATNVSEYGNRYMDIVYKLPELSEVYSIKGYLNGLKEEISNPVRVLKPSSLADAMHMAKLQERTNNKLQESLCESLNKRGYLANKGNPLLPTPRGGPTVLRSGISPFAGKSWNESPSINQATSVGSNAAANHAASSSVRSNLVPRRFMLDPKTYEEKRKQNLCFYCPEKWEVGHKCKNGSYMMCIEATEAELTEENLDRGTMEEEQGTLLYVGDEHKFETMKIEGNMGKHKVLILIDSGSSHNFISPRMVKLTGLKVVETSRLLVTIANGKQLNCELECEDFKWNSQGIEFNTHARVLSVATYDIILGVEWLLTLGTISWNFNALNMNFRYLGQDRCLQGLKSASISVIEGNKLQHSCKKGAEMWFMEISQMGKFQGLMFSLAASSPELIENTQLEELLTGFRDLFEEPHSLPPKRACDHQIPLQTDAKIVSLRPYHYPKLQKDEMEKLIEEMLNSGIIRKSHSPYSSPIVLVRKKDQSWRLCIDYRKLNEITIKDKFPIPLIEELLDELQGSVIFTKLDLRAGYHQIRMFEDDISKTAFKTHEGHYEFLVMPFGLTNAPSTFQRLMNDIFKQHLRKFVLVFFDDILIYSKSWQEHVEHLQVVFDILRSHQLYLKNSKCSFGCTEIEYLGHIISKQGVAVDMKKIQAILDWSTPTKLKQLRGFLGLTGYYRRFIRHYGSLALPLTKLIKQGPFIWSSEAAAAFEALKSVMTKPPVLALPDFEEPFIVETDASAVGMGAVLMQKGHPIAFISKGLGARLQAMSAYERELLAVIHAIRKWKSYLQYRPFIIRTDHQALKHLLEQRLHHPSQEKWLYKLMGFEYTVQYKHGKENVVADALSRLQDPPSTCFQLSDFSSLLLGRISRSWYMDPHLKEIIVRLQGDPVAVPGFTWINERLRKDGKLVVGNDKELRNYIISTMHNSAVGGHSGVLVTTKKLRLAYFWKGLEREVREYIRTCSQCQQQKGDNLLPKGLLQPLAIPNTVWADISMDFIEGLPKSHGHSVILVVVDRLSKMAHFISLCHPFTANTIAQVFLDNIFKLHGMPLSIVSDRDKIFISSFWKELCRLQGIQQAMSSAYHPQTDGQTEVVNRSVETYLRCMAGQKPKSWARWLPLAEWWYNTNFHSSAYSSPYEVVYGQPPPVHHPYLAGDSRIEAIDRSLSAREAAIKLLKFHLNRAQNRMKQQANKHRTDMEFAVDDWVYVKLQPYRQLSLRSKTHKLNPKFYGPFRIIARIGKVAYKLDIPFHSRMHNVIHISQLKRKIGSEIAAPIVPCFRDSVPVTPKGVLDERVILKNGESVGQYLVRWNGKSDDDASWEDESILESNFPNFLSGLLDMTTLVRGRTTDEGGADVTLEG